MPLVSVITIFLDPGALLDEAVESVLAQTYPHWELLLVDDGSTDGASALAEGWAARHPDRIRYLEHPGHENRGMSASRNLGVREARGEYLAFLDADDVYLPDKLAHQFRLLDAHPDAGMVYGASQYWYSWTGKPEDRARDRVRRQGVAPGVVQPPRLLAPLVRDEAQTPCTCGVLLRRSAFERAGGFEERFRGMYEDQAFFYKLFARVPVLVDGAVLDRYRQHPGSHVHTSRDAGVWHRWRPSPMRADFLRWLADFVRGEAVDDPDVARAIGREIRRHRSRLYSAMHFARHAASRLVAPGRRVADAIRRSVAGSNSHPGP